MNPVRRPVGFPPAPFAEPRLAPGLTNRGYYVEYLSGARSSNRVSIFLIPRNNPRRAYQIAPFADETAKKKYHERRLRCALYDCEVLERIDDNTYKQTDVYVKVKFFTADIIEVLHEQGHDENARTEISVAQQFGDGIHIVQCIDALQDEMDNLYMVMPLYRGGSLAENIPGGGFMGTGYDPRKLFLQIAKKIRYVHEQPQELVHHDFSADQVLLSSRIADMQDKRLPENFAVLTDFAMSLGITYLEGRPQNISGRKTVCGKLPYLTPEVCLRRPFGQSIDIWSFGCAIFYCVTGMYLYEELFDTFYTTFVHNGHLRPDDDTYLLQLEEELLLFQALAPNLATPGLLERIQTVLRMPKTLRDLLARIFQEDPEDRITLDAFVNHPWFRQRHPFQDGSDDDDDDDDKHRHYQPA